MIHMHLPLRPTSTRLLPHLHTLTSYYLHNTRHNIHIRTRTKMGSLPPPQRAPIRLAVLECDEPVGVIKEKYGAYGVMFKSLLDAGARHQAKVDKVDAPVELDITNWDVVNNEHYPKLEEVDAILITGSKYNSFDPDVWITKLVEFTQKVLAQDRVKIIGVCFGHQIIGRAMGNEVGRNEQGWEISVTEHELTEKGKKIFGLEKLSLHQMHRDVIYHHPTGVEALAYTPVCSVQGMYAHNRLISVQGHPEFNDEIVTAITEKRHAQGIFDDALYHDAMRRVSRPHDGVVVAAAFVRFLLDG